MPQQITPQFIQKLKDDMQNFACVFAKDAEILISYIEENYRQFEVRNESQ